jgi:hypothetical protein
MMTMFTTAESWIFMMQFVMMGVAMVLIARGDRNGKRGEWDVS